ncbi:PEP-CTERM putative exosortase interaction domain-containing protein [Opitutaceae bacterium TAV1]|nr:PEP-CTERM putative exosortase interaction domain-containing protein [Opitutaceae bacterium TAV1]
MKTKISRTRFRALLAFISVTVLAVSSPVARAADIRYSIDTAALDGTAGENTYVLNAGSSSTGKAALTKGGGQLTFALNGGTPDSTEYAVVLGYFDTVSLSAVGASVTLEYAVTVSTNDASHRLFNSTNTEPFRVGFFDSSASTKLTGNSPYMTSSVFPNYAGYTANMGGQSNYNAGSFNQRFAGGSNTALMSGLAKLNSGYTEQRIGYSQGIPNFTGIFKLERISDTEIRITSIMNGTASSEESIVVSSNLVGNIDTFGITGFAGSSDAVLTFTQLNVTAITPVPEPGTWALLLGATGLLAALILRR